jgi:hypothetical protein
MLTLQVRLPRSTIERLDRLRGSFSVRITRAQTIRWCLDNSLTALEEQQANVRNES